MRGAVLASWAASLGLITWRAFSARHRPPLPSELAATVVVFGTLAIAADPVPEIAGAMAVGLVVAGVLNVVPGIANLNTPGQNIGAAAQVA